MAHAKDKVFQMRVSEGFLRLIDNWRRTRDEIPPRAEAIRTLVEYGLQLEAIDGAFDIAMVKLSKMLDKSEYDHGEMQQISEIMKGVIDMNRKLREIRAQETDS